jgi:uroporphyrin-III C-methyltransferase/precorrin-2 dehydrogenase/sirohydrochlorin ferrochelatase
LDFFPVFLDLEKRDCLVVGGGRVAARKAGLLRRAGARMHVVAPQLCDELQRLAESTAMSTARCW